MNEEVTEYKVNISIPNFEDHCQNLQNALSYSLKEFFRASGVGHVNIKSDLESREIYVSKAVSGDSCITYEEDSTAAPASIFNSIEYTTIAGGVPETNGDNLGKGISCFNCGGDHSIKFCKVPKDAKKIQRAKNSFAKKSERYHETNENILSKFTPGKISDRLREALGLAIYDTPMFLRRMHRFGYPPAWLKEAEFRPSTLKIVDGKTVQDDELNISSIDETKLFDFPGLNEVKANMTAKASLKQSCVRPTMALIDKSLADSDLNGSECVVAETTLPLDTSHDRSTALFTFEGAPVIQSVSEFSSLPAGEHFSVGVSDVIHFENLPDSTGKYEKMKDVLSIVRKTLSSNFEQN